LKHKKKAEVVKHLCLLIFGFLFSGFKPPAAEPGQTNQTYADEQ
jgi:hypothetical protein